MNPLSKEEGLPRTSEPSEPAKNLPHPELNPLENPLLSENMHRWAEVYFNNPPERRDAAVVDLLEELLEEKRQRDEQIRKANPTFFPQSRVVNTSVGNHEKIVLCPACRTANPANHQFCGNCGQTLETGAERARENEPLPLERSGQGMTAMPAPMTALPAEPKPASQEFREEVASDEIQEFDDTPEGEEYVSSYEHEPRPFPPAYASNDLSLFQSLRAPADEGEEDWEYGPQPTSSYRYYVAVVLTILILGLGYLAWHSAQTSRSASAPPPTPAADSSPAPAPESSSAKAESSQPAPKNPAEPAANPPEASSNNEPKTPARQKEHGLTKASDTEPIASRTNTPSTGHSGPGAEELATAQRYLGGADGRGRDSSEAAKWLWKAISKHNGPATLMLADLYLKGDGVTKNCDQGRVLLDSAAQRGIAGAGERLRNLQAFGCR